MTEVAGLVQSVENESVGPRVRNHITTVEGQIEPRMSKCFQSKQHDPVSCHLHLMSVQQHCLVIETQLCLLGAFFR